MACYRAAYCQFNHFNKAGRTLSLLESPLTLTRGSIKALQWLPSKVAMQPSHQEVQVHGILGPTPHMGSKFLPLADNLVHLQGEQVAVLFVYLMMQPWPCTVS